MLKEELHTILNQMWNHHGSDVVSNGRGPQARKKKKNERTGMNTFDYCVFLSVLIALYELAVEF